jgi:hypothetical protein
MPAASASAISAYQALKCHLQYHRVEETEIMSLMAISLISEAVITQKLSRIIGENTGRAFEYNASAAAAEARREHGGLRAGRRPEAVGGITGVAAASHLSMTRRKCHQKLMK